ncbi:MAG: hypothetical protein WC511_02925 [Candidatus Pacearchaeota archaeon]
MKKDTKVKQVSKAVKIKDSSPTRGSYDSVKGLLPKKMEKTASIDNMVKEEFFPSHWKDKKSDSKFAAVAFKDPRSSAASSAHFGSMEDLSTFMAGNGINVHRDDFDTLDLFAQHIISLINTDVYSIANLTKHERFILLRYFYRSNPILGRVIDLHTEIPLSKLRLQPPQDCPKIVKDYMTMFFEKIFNRINFTEVLKDVVLFYQLLGEGYAMVDDYFAEHPRKLQSIEDLSGKSFDYKEEDLKFIEKIEKEYEADPKKVTVADRQKYFEKKFLGFFTKSYNGPDRLRALKFYDITEYFTNEEIGFEAIRHRISDGVQTILQDHNVARDSRNDDDYSALKDMGYSKGFIELLKQNRDSRDIVVDNDIYSGLPFLILFKRFETTSLAYRVLDACLAWDASHKAMKAKIKTIGRVGRIVKAPELGIDQLNALVAEVKQMIEDPTYAVVVNYDLTWEETNAFLKDELNQLIEAQDRLKQLISTGMGIPESLLSGESQYTGDNIKVEILNTQYFAFKVKFQNLLEDCFMKPMALRKGFIGLDDWGNLRLFYPKLTFSLLNLRSSEYFEMLMNLYNKGSLNIDVIYDLLNLDGDGIIHALKEDLWSLKSDKMNVLVEDMLHAAAEKMVQDTDYADKIIEALGLSKKSSVQQAEDELKSGGGAAGGGSSGGGMSMPSGGGSMDMGDLGDMGDEGEAPAEGETPDSPEPEVGGGIPSELPKEKIPVPPGQ